MVHGDEVLEGEWEVVDRLIEGASNAKVRERGREVVNRMIE